MIVADYRFPTPKLKGNEMLLGKSSLSCLSTASFVFALAVGIQAPVALTSPAFAANTTHWIQRDNPSGVGDFELTNELLTFQCRIVKTHEKVKNGQPGPGYHKGGKVNHGCWCVNSEQPGGCQNIEIKYKWP